MAEFESRKIWGAAPIVTELEQFRAFYGAEEHHQKYFERNPYRPYCLLVIAPKVAKLRGGFLAKLKKRPPRGWSGRAFRGPIHPKIYQHAVVNI